VERCLFDGYVRQPHVGITTPVFHTIRYDTIEEFNVDSKAEYSALSSTRSQKLTQTKQCPFNTVQVKIRECMYIDVII